jgi:hypothetical protein
MEKTDADITKDIISCCIEFFGLHLSCTLVAPHELQQIANHSYVFCYEKLFKLYVL